MGFNSAFKGLSQAPHNTWPKLPDRNNETL